MLVGKPRRLGAVRLLLLAEPGLHLAAQAVGLGPRTRLFLNRALLDSVDLVVRLAQLDVRVVEARLQPLLALGRLLAVLPELGHLLVGGDQVPLEPDGALLEIAASPVELADLVLVIEHLPLFGVERVAQVEDVLLFLVDDLAQPQELALLGEGGRLREPLPRLLDLLAQRLALVLQRMDPRFQLGVARLGLARAPVVARRHAEGLGDDAAAGLGRDVLEGDLVGSRRHVVLVGGRVFSAEVSSASGPAAPAQRLSGAVDIGIEARCFGNGLRAASGLRDRGRPVDLAGRLFPGQIRRQIVIGPEVPQIDHVAASASAILGRTRLQRREGGLGLRIELLPFERGVGDAVVRQDLLLGGVARVGALRHDAVVVGVDGQRLLLRVRSRRRQALLTTSMSSSSAITMSESASSSCTSSSSAAGAERSSCRGHRP